MRTVISFFILVALVIGLSPLFAYPVYLFINLFADVPFYKLVSHTTLLCGLIFSAVYLKYHDLYSREHFGFGATKPTFLKDVLIGIIAGIFILAVLKVILLSFGVHQIKPNLDKFWSDLIIIIIKAIITGLVVGLIEETIFRGALFSSLYKKTNTVLAITITSGVYAAVHFLKYREQPEGTEYHWLSGMEMLPEAFFKLSYPGIMDHFFTLFVLGVFFTLLRIKSGSIALCIGVHAGIVMAIKISGKFSGYASGSEFDFLVNRYDHLLGYLSLGWLTLLTILFWQFALKKRL